MLTANSHVSVESSFAAFATLTSPLQFFPGCMSLEGAWSWSLDFFSNSCSLLLAVCVIFPQLMFPKQS